MRDIVVFDGGEEDSRVEDPVVDAAVRVVGRVGGGGPVGLHLADQAVLVLLGALLNLGAFGAQEAGELVHVPGVVRLDDVVLPVVLDQVFQVLAVGGSWVRDVVVRQPALQLSLVPFVIC